MSKFKIKFTYGQSEDENFKQVKSVHKGPINLTNIYDTLYNPTYEEIQFEETKNPEYQQVTDKPIQTNASPEEHKITNQGNPDDPDEKEIEKTPAAVVVEKGEVQQEVVVESQGGRVRQSDSTKPTFQIEEVRESDFKEKKEEKQQKEPQEEIPGQVVLRAPRFKVDLDDEKEGKLKAIKKEFVRVEKGDTSSGAIPQKNEDEFVGCFSCCAKKNKAYRISKDK